MNDILIHDGAHSFSYRVAGILRHQDKVLLQYDAKDRTYAFIGGHVAFLETSDQALVREWNEELGIQIQVQELVWLGEIFFRWNHQHVHQISFYYEVRVNHPEHLPHHHGTIEFRWVSLSELHQITLYPQAARDYLIAPIGTRFHFVDHQL